MNEKIIVIIDFQLGNLFSVKQACETVGLKARISSEVNEILNADALILPGVGAFNEAMENLKKLKIDTAIKHKVKNGTPIFGICLGLQLLFTRSEEFGSANGHDIISGFIKKFPEKFEERKILVPHISWNTILNSKQNWKTTALTNLKENDFMYFVHSYYVEPNNNSVILTFTNYDGIKFCSSIQDKNIFATQFHPEKSGDKGISIYKNWGLINNLIKK